MVTRIEVVQMLRELPIDTVQDILREALPSFELVPRDCGMGSAAYGCAPPIEATPEFHVILTEDDYTEQTSTYKATILRNALRDVTTPAQHITPAQAIEAVKATPAIVYQGHEEDCHRVWAVLRRGNVKATVTPVPTGTTPP